jgi:hypothetical protein
MSRDLSPRAPVFEALEERKLLSADPLGLLPVGDASFAVPLAAEIRTLEPAPDRPQVVMSAAPASEELVLVDEATPEADRLIADLLAARGPGSDIEVVKLDGQRDGIAQVSEVLASRGPLCR